MKRKSFHLSSLLLFIVFMTVKAQENENKVEQLDEVVVTATKFTTESWIQGKKSRSGHRTKLGRPASQTITEYVP